MLGVWLVTTLSLLGLVIGAMAGPFMPWGDSETFKSFNAFHYLQPFVLFIIINALFVSAIYTAIAVTTRNKALVYVSAVGLLVLYLIGGIVAGNNPDDWVAALIDPFGSTSMALITEYWPAAEQNNNMVPFMSWVGINRLVYALIGLVLFSLSFKLSTRGIQNRSTKSKLAEVVPTDIPTKVSPVQPNIGRGFGLSSFWTRLKFEYLSTCLLYTSPSPRDRTRSRMPSSA